MFLFLHQLKEHHRLLEKNVLVFKLKENVDLLEQNFMVEVV